MDSINKQYPWLHASPEFFCSCDCLGGIVARLNVLTVLKTAILRVMCSNLLHAKKRTALAGLSSRKIPVLVLVPGANFYCGEAVL